MNVGGADPYEALAAMVFRLDAEGLIGSVNQAAIATLGLSRAELEGTRFDALASSDGRGRHLFRNASGVPLAAVVAESGAGADGGTLVTAVAAPPADDTAEDAKLAALGELAHHVVHELNQPLSVIRMAIGTARRKLSVDGVDADFIDAKLERIDNQCVRAAAIVEYMRVFVPRNRALNVALDVNRAVENAAGMAAPKFRQLNVVLKTTLGEPCRVLGNEMHIEPALLCVLGEVFDRVASPGHERPVEIELRVARADRETVEIIISDTAGRAGARPEGTGALSLGMGIPMARALAGELGGRLDVEPGAHGTTYRFTLPAARDDAI